MPLITRRRAILATGTVAALAVPRKPRAELGRSISDLTPTSPRRPLPPIRFTSADGTPHTLSDFAGRGVVLNLWATWCVPCVAEMPSLDQLAGQSGADMAVLPLSSDRGGAPVVEHFYRDHAIRSLGIWLDPHGDATQALNLRGIPTTIIIDRGGLEAGRIEGAVAWGAPGAAAAIKTLVG